MDYVEALNQLATVCQNNSMDIESHQKDISANAALIGKLLSVTAPIAEDVSRHTEQIRKLEEDYAVKYMTPVHLGLLENARKERIDILLSDMDASMYKDEMHRALNGSIKQQSEASAGFKYEGSYKATLDKYFDPMLAFINSWVPVGGVDGFIKRCDRHVTREDVLKKAGQYNKHHADTAEVTFGGRSYK